ncbi:MAG: F0F1 ATP synthase subunit B [Bacteroidales bacterium]|jgi:F-type H+-transporting ATPase subunit b|nr:F0F1 ATP synthase subunit B [Bacteroidales bacterium]
MELINPDIGLIIWMTISFLILLLLLGKFAWIPVLKMLNEREKKINEALNEANLAREQMKQLTADNERLLMVAKEKREAIINDGRKISQKMYDEAKAKVQEESQRILAAAKDDINIEKQKAITDIRNMIAEISLEIAEKVIEDELSDKQKHQHYVDKRIEKLKFN